MSCDKGNNKRLGEDWNFFFKFKDENGDLIDLNGYLYSYIIANEDGTIVKQDSGTLAISGTELAVGVSGSDTLAYSEGLMKIEFKITDAEGNIFITDSAVFYAVKTLHSIN